jgi:hypothetical protein
MNYFNKFYYKIFFKKIKFNCRDHDPVGLNVILSLNSTTNFQAATLCTSSFAHFWLISAG